MATLNEEIGKLIARRLLANEAIALPEIGSLYTKRIGAKRISARWIEPPHRVVEFSDAPMGHSLIDEIRHEAHCSEEQAADAYARWRAKATQEGRLTIDGVGVLCLKSLTPTETFEKRLNPQGHEPIKVKRRPMPWWAWTLATLSVVTVLFGTFAWFVNPLEVWKKWHNEQPKQIASTEEPATTTETESSVTEAAKPQPAEAIRHDTIESASTQQREEKDVAPVTVRATGSDQITPTRAAHSYVVMGIYSTEANARRAIEQAVKRYNIPQGDFSLYRYDDKYLVSLGETEMRADAQEVARRYRTEYGAREVWVYSKVKR